MTTPSIDTILSAISPPPAGLPPRTAQPFDSFQEHLRLQPYDEKPPADLPSAENEPPNTDPPARSEVPQEAETNGEVNRAQPEKGAPQEDEDTLSTDQGCVDGECGVRTAQTDTSAAPTLNEVGEAYKENADTVSPVEEEAASAKRQPQRAENAHARELPVEEAESTANLQPSEPEDDAAAALAENEQRVTKPKSSVPVEDESPAKKNGQVVKAVAPQTGLVTEDSKAVADEGEAEVKTADKTVPVVASPDKQTPKRTPTEKPVAKWDAASGERTQNAKSPSPQTTAAANSKQEPPADDGDRQPGQGKPKKNRDAASPPTNAALQRSPAAERVVFAKATATVEPLPPASAEDASAPPTKQEAAPAPNNAPQPSSPTTATVGPTAAGDRLSTLLAKPQAAERQRGSTLTEAQQARLVQRVAKAFDVAQSRGDTTIRLRLSPPQLGSLLLEVQVESGALVARLEVETHAAREALVDNLHALRQRLAEQNIRVENFDVDLMDRQQEGPAGRREDSSMPQRDRQQRGDSPQRAAGRQNDREQSREQTRPSHLPLDDKNIDVLI